MDKRELREKILARRDLLSQSSILKSSEVIIEKLTSISEYLNSTNIMTFVSYSSEVDTHNLIIRALAEGKKVYVPVTKRNPREMNPSRIKSFEDLVPGYFNILTPKKEKVEIVEPEKLDLVIVPGVLFDKAGFRIGYGGGYYDRFLPQLRKDVKKIAIAFELQVQSDKLPVNSFDIPVDMIITEESIYRIEGDSNA